MVGMYTLLQLKMVKGYKEHYVEELFTKHNEHIKRLITGGPENY